MCSSKFRKILIMLQSSLVGKIVLYLSIKIVSLSKPALFDLICCNLYALCANLALFIRRYFDKTPKHEQRMGNVKGNVMERLENGFTKSTTVHKLGPDLDPKEEIRRLQPYVARFVRLGSQL